MGIDASDAAIRVSKKRLSELSTNLFSNSTDFEFLRQISSRAIKDKPITSKQRMTQSIEVFAQLVDESIDRVGGTRGAERRAGNAALLAAKNKL